jgi:hypothetical protein
LCPCERREAKAKEKKEQTTDVFHGKLTFLKNPAIPGRPEKQDQKTKGSNHQSDPKDSESVHAYNISTLPMLNPRGSVDFISRNCRLAACRWCMVANPSVPGIHLTQVPPTGCGWVISFDGQVNNPSVSS